MNSLTRPANAALQVKLLQSGSAEKPSDHFGHHIIPQALSSELKVAAHHFDGYWRVSASLHITLYIQETTTLQESTCLLALLCIDTLLAMSHLPEHLCVPCK